MTVIYHSRGQGTGSGPVEYLLGKNQDREKAELLRGDPETTKDLIDSLDFKRKYTSGVLSFTETDLSDDVKNKIMDSFEKATFCGLEKSQYDILWVEHTDKKNLELNFVIPNVELETGKRFQPYYHQADKTRINQFRDLANIEHGLTNPLSPEHRQSLTMPKNLPRDKKQIREVLDNHFLKGIENGTIRNREDIRERLEKAGFEIKRETEKSISIADPNGGQNIRLKGAIYEQSFQSTGQTREVRQRAGREFEEQQRAGYEDLRRKHTDYIERKAEGNRQKYCQNRQEPHQSKDMERFLTPNDLTRSSSHNIGSGLSAGQEIKGAIHGIKETRTRGRNSHSQDLGYNNSQERRGNQVPGSSREYEGSEPRRMGGENLPTARGELKNDRNRTTIIERLRGLREGARARAEQIGKCFQRLGRSFKDFTGTLQTGNEREQDIKRQSGIFERASQSIDKAIGTIKHERYMAQKKSYERDNGLEW